VTRVDALERISAEVAILSAALDSVSAVVGRTDLDRDEMAAVVRRLVATARRRVAGGGR